LVNGTGDAVTVKIGVPTEFGSRFIVVTGAPYSAEQILEHEQTLADGTHIRQKQTVQRLTLDSQGRVRISRSQAIRASGKDRTSSETPMFGAIVGLAPSALATRVMAGEGAVLEQVDAGSAVTWFAIAKMSRLARAYKSWSDI